MKDYDIEIHHHLGKANVVADALSRKSTRSLACTLVSLKVNGLLANVTMEPALIGEIKARQWEDKLLKKRYEEQGSTLDPDFIISNGILKFRNRICIPDIPELKKKILEKAHNSRFAVHPGNTKMYHDLKEHYWWTGMKKDIANHVSKCLHCQQVKAEHQRPAGLLQPLPIPEWKWEHITMDFVVGLPQSFSKNDAIWVIVDRLTKSAHFLSIKIMYPLNKFATLYIKEIIRLHGIPVSIVSDRDPRFVSHFWNKLQEALGTTLKFSTAYYPQTDGQSERTIQTLENMLRICVLDLKGNWDEHLPLVEFAYNNSYQASIGMAPYEALYGRRCRSPLCWTEVRDRKLLGPEIVQIASEKIQLIQQRIRTAQSRQKSYADTRRRDLEFQVGDHVFLKISPTREVIRFRKCGKLNPRYIGPFEILERIGPVAYRLALPPELSNIHNVFHVSMLRRYLRDPGHVIDYENLEVREDLSYEEQPV
ncbi:unnamed protein product [Camellia sinensis]